nr:SGNH/GDSL hydrolase family protein [Rosenbergiella collisarenosi]
MSNSAQTLSIDTVGNTGTVSILGAYLSSSDKGIVVNKMGCGGTVSGQHLRILDQIPNFTPDLDLDLIILNLGVNDYLQNREPSEYSLNIGKIIDAYKTALPNVGFILVSPAQVNADSQYKMTDYRDAMKQIAKDKGVEWFGFYDDMPSDYSAGNALGAYQDNYHLSDIGAEAYITPIYQNFIKQ